jgi:glutathione synthase/RimK-type ligase-like ATP-grasp enzyme
MRPIAVIYEHEAWMAPVFEALDREGAPYERVFANAQAFDPTAPAPDWSLAVNKVSPSSYLRGHAPSIAFARQFLPFLEERGIPVVNGSDAFRLETSKALQLLLLHRIGVRAPAAHVVNDPARIADAARGLRFPVIVKPNIGGSGALARRFDSVEAIREAAASIDLGPDGTGLVQEYLEPQDGSIVRVEFLDGEILYAIKIWSDTTNDFNLCPADICQVPAAEIVTGAVNELTASTAKKPMRIEAFDVPDEMADAVLRIAREGRLDVGGVEYLVAARDGLPYVYDVNALSNFVTDAVSLVGYDPHQRFARYLISRARQQAAA